MNAFEKTIFEQAKMLTDLQRKAYQEGLDRGYEKGYLEGRADEKKEQQQKLFEAEQNNIADEEQ